MIKDRWCKATAIIGTIRHEMTDAAPFRREMPAPYQKALLARRRAKNAADFVASDGNLHLAWEMLDAWGMNARSAKLKHGADFLQSIRACAGTLGAADKATAASDQAFRQALAQLYGQLHVMQTSLRLVSNAKLLHLLYPDRLMPIDGQHTLAYLYGHQGAQSAKRYLEIVQFQQEILAVEIDWRTYLDDAWNTTPPKLIDNAIIILRRKQRLDAKFGS